MGRRGRRNPFNRAKGSPSGSAPAKCREAVLPRGSSDSRVEPFRRRPVGHLQLVVGRPPNAFVRFLRVGPICGGQNFLAPWAPRLQATPQRESPQVRERSPSGVLYLEPDAAGGKKKERGPLAPGIPSTAWWRCKGHLARYNSRR